jgi:hypothetical protein
MSWRAGILVRDPCPGPFTRSDTPQFITFTSKARLIVQASIKFWVILPSMGTDKTPASTSTHFRPSPHHASTPPHHHNSVQQSDQVTLLLQPTLFLEFTRPLRPAVTTSTFPNQSQQHRHHAPTPCDHHPAHRRRCGAVRAQPPAQALGAAASSAAGFFAVNHRVREHQGASSLRSHEEQERAHHGWEWTR